MNNKAVETLQSRKFWFSVLTITGAVGLYLTKQIEVEVMTDMVKWSSAVYVGALSFEDGLKKLLPALGGILREKND